MGFYDSASDITNCYAVGTIASSAFNAGGLVGWAGANNWWNCGWNIGSGPFNAIGAGVVVPVTYDEFPPTVFQSTSHGVYTAYAPQWDFVTPVWYEAPADYPKLTATNTAPVVTNVVAS